MNSRYGSFWRMGRLSKFDYFSRSLVDIFARAPDLTPYDPIIPTQDLNEKNPKNTAAARLSESLDLSTPDRVDDQLYDRILWLMLRGDVPPPVAQNHAGPACAAIEQMMMIQVTAALPYISAAVPAS